MIDRVRQYVQRHRLLSPGDRVAVAVSGGADSVALLRALLELRRELGIVLSVAHFHHGIRGAEADADQQFVKDLAANFHLDIHLGAADVPTHARTQKTSLETAARELRHRWFFELVRARQADKIATAHTLDDQAETVLMRVLRGAGALGLAGIFPQQEEKHLVRPLLEVSRTEIEAYLRTIGQLWCDDSMNLNLEHTRNRIRRQLLPQLERDYNPALRQTLADLAEVARGEAEYWNREVDSLLPRLVRPGKPSRSGRSTAGKAAEVLSLDLAAFQNLPLAAQRQILQRVGRQLGTSLEFKHIQQLTAMISGRAGAKRLLLPGGIAVSRSFRELQFGHSATPPLSHDYSYSLPVPGEVNVLELGARLRARIVPGGISTISGYNPDSLLDRSLLAPQVTVRNWRAGDRFFPAKTRSPKKLKELLQAGRMGQRLSVAQRKRWPVVESAGQIVWVRGFAVPAAFAPRAGEAVLIEEVEETLAE
ncbi:MAG TPA: tRNA lysidine(34) synthetase TilS [Candidatus Angelobacter sp.]|nr:tRNA lysidine(34) synthetase TilS [Candidatus Angelobacter sp.]